MLLMVSGNSATSSAVNDGKARQRQFDLMRNQLRQTRAQMRRRLGERDRQIAEQTQKIAEQERSLAELNRRVVEYDQRFDDIAAEVARVTSTKKRRASPDTRQSKRAKNADVGPAATQNVCYLRSGRQVTYK